MTYSSTIPGTLMISSFAAYNIVVLNTFFRYKATAGYSVIRFYENTLAD